MKQRQRLVHSQRKSFFKLSSSQVQNEIHSSHRPCDGPGFLKDSLVPRFSPIFAARHLSSLSASIVDVLAINFRKLSFATTASLVSALFGLLPTSSYRLAHVVPIATFRRLSRHKTSTCKKKHRIDCSIGFLPRIADRTTIQLWR